MDKHDGNDSVACKDNNPWVLKTDFQNDLCRPFPSEQPDREIDHHLENAMGKHDENDPVACKDNNAWVLKAEWNEILFSSKNEKDPTDQTDSRHSHETSLWNKNAPKVYVHLSPNQQTQKL